jgi:photosystem II stability/assembly factor-like uncharacterized protein
MSLARSVVLLLVCVSSLPAQAPQSSSASLMDSRLFEPWQWRSVGPIRGGRALAVAGSVPRPLEYYFGAVGGGLWKTTDAGTTWDPVSDRFFSSASVGSVAVCNDDPDVVYAGMGEGQWRAIIATGDGIYRSSDGGQTWSHKGLESSTGQQVVARIRVHPNDCDIVYAAVLGDPWGPNEERGVFRSTDGGDSWERILYRHELAGATDLVLDPTDPTVLYAAIWDAARKPWLIRTGDQSGLFKSTNGGDSWVELTNNAGLPDERIGKAGISVSATRPNRLYAVIEAADKGGVYRSDDGGETWQLVNGDRGLYARSEYYMRIFADPVDPDRVYVLNQDFYRSDDGGVTYRQLRGLHGDHHDLWIDPQNPLRMIEGNDGGASVSVTEGRTWTDQDYPTAQMYHVIATDDFPYYVCGAQQDSSSKCLPSDGDGSYWYDAAAGEQGFIAPHPTELSVAYGGAQRGGLMRLDRRTGQRQRVDVWPNDPQGLAAGEVRERFQWTYPIVTTPLEPDVVYAASQHLWRSENEGRSWKRISPDLTYGEPETLVRTEAIFRNQNSQDYYGTIFAVAVSRWEARTIWTGSDDGMVHVTRDGGASWSNVTPPDLPKFSRVSSIEPSPHDPARAYLAIERYKMQDPAPYIFKTEDYGLSWVMITAGIAPGHFVRAVREDPVRPGLLFAGTEHGPYVSFDDGSDWQELRLNLPDLQISDLVVKDDDVVIATFGRSLFILDDISPLRELRGDLLQRSFHLFGPAEAVRSRSSTIEAYSRVSVPGLNRVDVFYHLREPASRITVEFSDDQGRIVRTFTGSPADEGRVPSRSSIGDVVNGPRWGWSTAPPHVGTSPGLQRITWDMRYAPATEFMGMRIRGARMDGPFVLPGDYDVRITVDGESQSRSFRISKDDRLADVSSTDLEAQFALASRIHARINEATSSVVLIRAIRDQVEDRLGRTGDAGIAEAGSALRSGLTDIESEIYESRLQGPTDALRFGVRLTNKLSILLGQVESADARPTEQSQEVFEQLSGELEDQLSRLQEILRSELEEFNEALRERGLDPIRTDPRIVA